MDSSSSLHDQQIRSCAAASLCCEANMATFAASSEIGSDAPANGIVMMVVATILDWRSEPLLQYNTSRPSWAKSHHYTGILYREVSALHCRQHIYLRATEFSVSEFTTADLHSFITCSQHYRRVQSRFTRVWGYGVQQQRLGLWHMGTPHEL